MVMYTVQHITFIQIHTSHIVWLCIAATYWYNIALRVSVLITDPLWVQPQWFLLTKLNNTNNSKGSKHNNQSFNELIATNKSGCCKHLDVGCNQGLTWHLDPLIPSSLHSNPRQSLDKWWAIYIIVSLTHLYCSRSNFWSYPIDHNVSILFKQGSNKLQSLWKPVCYLCSTVSTHDLHMTGNCTHCNYLMCTHSLINHGSSIWSDY